MHGFSTIDVGALEISWIPFPGEFRLLGTNKPLFVMKSDFTMRKFIQTIFASFALFALIAVVGTDVQAQDA